MPYLRQSTSQTIRFGPCLDKTDGVTEETALTLAQADMRLSKDGGAFAQKNASGNATHDSDGWYSTTLNTTDTNTVGELILNVHQPANMLPVWLRWYVIEEPIYDALFGGAATGFDANQRVDVGAWLGQAVPTPAVTGVPRVDTQHINGIDKAAVVLAGWLNEGKNNAADSGTTTTLVDAANDEADDHWNGTLLVFISGTNDGRARVITDFDAATDTITFTPALPDAVTTESYVLIPGLCLSDVQAWLGTAPATPTVAGVPEVDVTHLGGGAQSATDLKDFADAGYDPAANKVEGVKLVDTTTANTDMRGTDSAALASVATEARLAELDPANLPADVDAILVDTGTTLDTKLDDIQGATFSSATDSLEAIRDRGDAAWTTGGGTGLTPLASGTAQGGTASTIQLAAGETFADDELNGNVVKITSGTGAGQSRVITDYAGATDTATIAPNWTTNPDATSVYEVVEGSSNVVQVEGLDATDQIRDSILDDATRFSGADIDAAITSRLAPTVAGRTLDVTPGGAAGIDWANVENPTTALDLSGTDIQLVDTTTINTDMRGTDSAALASVVGALADAAAAGDPTATDTIVAYVKQLINTLEGTTGIPTYPAAADPANNVSIAEAIRAIRDDVTGIAGAAMRGTDNAALASVLGALADAAADGDPTAVDTLMQYVKQLVNILVGTTGIVTFPAEAAPANNVSLAEVMRAIHADVTGLAGAAMRGTDSAALASVATEARLAELDAANLPADVDLILADTNELQTDDVPGLIAALNDLSAAQVNTEVADVLKTDTIAELSQAAPTATPSFEAALMLLYMALRNKLDITAGFKEVHNDAGTVITKKVLSDDGTTYSEAEMVTGP